VTGMVPLPVEPTRENLRYLTAKRDRLGHRIDGLSAPDGDGRPSLAGGLAEAR
jgi:3,4-dihydroxy 2-butanone 4-phosphate synthase/GTP cyclohydrolase II